MSKTLISINKNTVSCDPGSPEFYNNPYPVYDRMRDIGECFFWHEYNIWCFAHHTSVNAILRDRRFGRQMPGVDVVADAPDHLKPFYKFESNSILELEPPRHTQLKRLITRAFVSRKIDNLRPAITALAHRLIDAFEPAGHVDLLPRFAEIIPVYVIADMLGVPTKYSDQLLAWSHAMVAMYQHNKTRRIEDEAVAATQEFSQFILNIVEQRRTSPKDDLISHLVAMQENTDALNDDELVTTCILLLNAGHEATVHAIGNGVNSLLLHCDNPAELFTDHKNHSAICEEVMRHDPPLHKFTRYVLEDVEIGGRKFNRGDTIGLLLGAANRDPEKFTHPNQLDFNRPGLAAVNMAFGAGIHFCIGAPLARLEMQIALPVLFERLPKLRLVGTPQYADRYHFHGLSKLMVKW